MVGVKCASHVEMESMEKEVIQNLTVNYLPRRNKFSQLFSSLYLG